MRISMNRITKKSNSLLIFFLSALCIETVHYGMELPTGKITVDLLIDNRTNHDYIMHVYGADLSKNPRVYPIKKGLNKKQVSLLRQFNADRARIFIKDRAQARALLLEIDQFSTLAHFLLVSTSKENSYFVHKAEQFIFDPTKGRAEYSVSLNLNEKNFTKSNQNLLVSCSQ